MSSPLPNPRFPGFDVLPQAPAWDPITRGVVLRRLGPPPKIRAFTEEEEAVCRPMLDRLLGMSQDRPVPVFELIDARLAEDETDGWRYEDMPPDTEAWKRSMRHLGEDARERFGAPFAVVGHREQDRLLEDVRTGTSWHDLPAPRVWSLWIRYACAAFYSHPYAWNEIGFGGPAYPRGYANLGLDKREHWEVPEIDAFDPEPWSHRVERSRRRQRDGRDDAGDDATGGS